MKIRNFLILGLVLLGFTYCSSDDALPGATDNENATGVKMQLVVNMPTGVSTRTKTGSEGEELGTNEESKATTVGIAIYKADGTSLVHYFEKPLTQISGNAKYETAVFGTEGKLAVGNSYLVYLLINPPTGLSHATLNDALTLTGSNFSTAIATIATDDAFFMTNANTVAAQEVLATAKNQATPYKIIANVERAAARFDYKAANAENEYVVNVDYDSNSDVKVKFTHYKLINTSKSFYNFRRVNDGSVPTTLPGAANIGGDEIVTNYVVDTDWDVKSTATGWEAGFFSHLSGNTFNDSEGYKELPVATTDTKISYVTENTIPLAGNNAGKKGLATAIVFKGELIVPSDAKYGTEGIYDEVFVWNNKFYGVYDKLPNSVKAAITADLMGTDKEKQQRAGVTGYKKVGTSFPIYYVYYNRHNDNENNAITGPMEFAVVRNNVYKLSITKVQKFGHSNDPENPSPTNPDPNPEKPGDPIEVDDIYMTVEATVLPWTVRTNNIEF